ncbi:kinase-like protein [Cylindrobasidium torrendii FP15055 ss-10]|uniref:Kinase-like protein n=1 Tax=Cylindrobasidium torrendii FP15055 ss-10 TaxID=1314674 RepID=A0A0D7BVI8_9AGAR|nr:kinase-like protein [Cylindrobasidium torrendii FP15055 ss-10]
MSLPWKKRKERLQVLLKSHGDEGQDGVALDRLLHGASVIGKTSQTAEIDDIRVQDADFRLVGILGEGGFGKVEVVNCRLNNRVYVRKTIDKLLALRQREICLPQLERDILIKAKETRSDWAPHLLCAFQTPLQLKLVMDFAEGGTLDDVLLSSPLDGRISESDVRWWAPQIVASVHWCHTQGYVHRDIKPSNFVIKPTGHLLIIDFGTAAPLQPPRVDGSQRLFRTNCLCVVGTCDYVSPEILRAHEAALVDLEMSGESAIMRERDDDDDEVYGRETDWWSVGSMLYEMAYGVAPFYSESINVTHNKIMDPNRYIRFKANFTVSMNLQRLIGGLLKEAEFRLGRHNIIEITSHEFFRGVNWDNIATRTPPADLHMPHFDYADPDMSITEEPDSKQFGFSGLFQSSPMSSSPALSILRDVATPRPPRDETSSAFIGFSWGPKVDSFPESAMTPVLSRSASAVRIPRSVSPMPTPGPPPIWSTPLPATNTRFSTPLRSGSTRTPYQTLSVNRNSTIRRTVGRRTINEREALRQLVDLVGMSARKRVMESGRKPRHLLSTRNRSGSIKELRFEPLKLQPQPTQDAKVAVNGGTDTEGDSETDTDGPPSPSPRPGSSLSRRSATPTTASGKFPIGEISTASGNSSRRSRSLSVSIDGRQKTGDDLEMRHADLLHSIHTLEKRLEMLLSSVGDDNS